MKIDYDLVFLKSENARKRLKDLSKILRKTSQRLKYNLDVLNKEGILKDPFVVFDYSYFGLILFKVYFKGGYVSEKDKANIIKELYQDPYIASIYELTGEFDLALELLSPNPSKFNKELKRIITKFPTLSDYKIILNLVTHIMPRDYLAEKANIQDFSQEKVIGGDRVPESFNNSEMIVMKSVLLNPAIRISDLARETDLNSKTVKSILNKLEKRNIIKAYRHILNTDKIDVQKFRLFLRLHNLNMDKETRLINFLRQSKEVVQVNKTVGDWDLEIDAESFDKVKIRKLIISLREEYKEIIEHFNLIEFHTYYKRAYLPFYLFKDDGKS